MAATWNGHTARGCRDGGAALPHPCTEEEKRPPYPTASPAAVGFCEAASKETLEVWSLRNRQFKYSTFLFIKNLEFGLSGFPALPGSDARGSHTPPCHFCTHLGVTIPSPMCTPGLRAHSSYSRGNFVLPRTGFPCATRSQGACCICQPANQLCLDFFSLPLLFPA